MSAVSRDSVDNGPGPTESLAPSGVIDSDHPEIVAATARITAGAACEVQRAVRLHDFVRDEVRFGWAPGFDRYRASEVLRDRIGFCNAKATLLAALLRAAGIPARIHCASIHREVLAGLIRPPQVYLDHCYVEAWLGGRWIGVDSYNLDRPLHEAAKARLRSEGRRIGYGVHAGGSVAWDGRSPAFCQFVDDGSIDGFSNADFGSFTDLTAFKASGRGRNVEHLPARIVTRWLTRAANRRVERLRALEGVRPQR